MIMQVAARLVAHARAWDAGEQKQQRRARQGGAATCGAALAFAAMADPVLRIERDNPSNERGSTAARLNPERRVPSTDPRNGAIGTEYSGGTKSLVGASHPAASRTEQSRDARQDRHPRHRAVCVGGQICCMGFGLRAYADLRHSLIRERQLPQCMPRRHTQTLVAFWVPRRWSVHVDDAWVLLICMSASGE
jgi:hypothetical protein